MHLGVVVPLAASAWFQGLLTNEPTARPAALCPATTGNDDAAGAHQGENGERRLAIGAQGRGDVAGM
jgi:hypothetical protein